jgi:hypothetical protein
MIVLVFTPNSLRWLISPGRNEEVLEILVIANAHCNRKNPLVLIQYKEITDTLRYKKERKLSFVQVITPNSNRKKLTIASTFTIIVILLGANTVTCHVPLYQTIYYSS